MRRYSRVSEIKSRPPVSVQVRDPVTSYPPRRRGLAVAPAAAVHAGLGGVPDPLIARPVVGEHRGPVFGRAVAHPPRAAVTRLATTCGRRIEGAPGDCGRSAQGHRKAVAGPRPGVPHDVRDAAG